MSYLIAYESSRCATCNTNEFHMKNKALKLPISDMHDSLNFYCATESFACTLLWTIKFL